MRLVVRPLQSPREFAEAEDVQMSAWGMSPRGATPKDVMIAISDTGGVVLGAFDGARMVGFALTLVGYDGESTFLHSHMTGVSKEYQSKGVGYRLKQKQREIALARGFSTITWTFDPIIARNAYFNFVKLGTVARNYLVDYYGPMNDSINAGWPTDRFFCEWHIRPSVLSRVRSYGRLPTGGSHVAITMEGKGPDALCSSWRVDLRAESVLVDIPVDVVALKAKLPDEAKRWREATRDIFRRYFAAGYSAVALKPGEGRLQYLLIKADLPPGGFTSHRPRPRSSRTTY